MNIINSCLELFAYKHIFKFKNDCQTVIVSINYFVMKLLAFWIKNSIKFDIQDIKFWSIHLKVGSK